MAHCGDTTDPTVDIAFYEEGVLVHEITGRLIPRIEDVIRLVPDIDRDEESQFFEVVEVVWRYTTDVNYHDGSHNWPSVSVHVRRVELDDLQNWMMK